MKIRYLLKKKAKDTYLVYIALYDNDETAIISTGERSTLKEWTKPDGKNGRMPKDHDSDLFHDVEKIKSAVLKVKRLMDANDQPVTPFKLKQEYDNTLKEKQEKQHHQDKQDKVNLTAISSLIDKWIKVGLDNYKPLTKKIVKSSLTKFQAYLKGHHPKLERKELTLDIIAEYARHLQVKEKLKDSSHGRFMKHLRWFLKYIKFDGSQIKEIKIRTVKPDERNIIHLTAEELTALEAVDVSESVEMQKAKDMFLLGCYTGLRISDLKRIAKHRIKNGAIEMTLTKNSKNVSIPMLAQTKAILERYKFTAPRIAEQKVNENIKKVCAKAGIDEPIVFKSKRGGLLIEKVHPKHKLITSHCAGKTFISLAEEKWKLTPTDVAAIVGKDTKTILAYYWKTDIEKAKQKMIDAEEESKKKIIEAARRAQMKKVS